MPCPLGVFRTIRAGSERPSAKAAKEVEIRERFDVSASRYYQILNSLIDRPEALAHDPLLVKRLRRMREQRQRNRSAARLTVR